MAKRMKRARLPEIEIEKIRRDRYEPSPTHWHYLHLMSLLEGLKWALARLPDSDGPVLDLYCGTQPYRDVISRTPFWGFDLDLHFGRADVVGEAELPFRDAAFELVVCTQALYLVENPTCVVAEMERVLTPGGYVIVTVPHLFRRELAAERKYRASDLECLFGHWGDVQIRGFGGVGTGIGFGLGSLGAALERRWKYPKLFYLGAAVTLNFFGALLDLVAWPLHRQWPAILVIMARRIND